MKNPSHSRAALLLAFMATVAGSSRARAHSFVDETGGVFLEGYFLYPPSDADIAEVYQQVEIANRILWDATDGQLFIDRFTLSDNLRDRGTSQVQFHPSSGSSTSGRSTVTYQQESGRYLLSGSVTTFTRYDGEHRGYALGHELGHLVLGLQDEYPKNAGSCGGRGPCIVHPDEHNSCIMQAYRPGAAHELCTDDNHALLRGDGPDGPMCQRVEAGEVVCESGCEKFNEEAQLNQSHRSHQPSCWTKVVTRYPFMSAPVDSVEPAAGTAPVATILNHTGGSDVIVLLADVSGSMSLPAVGAESSVICTYTGNAEAPDQAECADSRMRLLRNAVDLFSTASRGSGFRVALKTFNSTTVERVAMQPLTASSAPQYQGALSTVTPGGTTGIGTALLNAGATLDVTAEESDARSILLITDGENSTGPNPVPVATDLVNDGTRIYTVVTGKNDDFGQLPALEGDGIDQTMASDATFLPIAMIRLWAKLAGRFALMPPVRYDVDSKLRTRQTLSSSKLVDGASSWPAATGEFIAKFAAPETRVLELVVSEQPDRTRSLDPTIVLTSPSGSKYTSAPGSTSPGLNVTRRNGSLFARVAATQSGEWTVAVQPGLPGRFRGVIQAFVDNRDAFSVLRATQLEKNVWELAFEATYRTALSGLSGVEVRAVSRAGETIKLRAIADPEYPSSYVARLDLRGKGTALWDVMAAGQSGPNTKNDPGEPLFEGPGNGVRVPALLFHDRLALQTVK